MKRGAMVFDTVIDQQDPLREAIRKAYLADETAVVTALLDEAAFSPDEIRRTQDTARELIIKVREGGRKGIGLDAFMNEYDLSTEEGVVLMCLSEALLRIPDAETADRLIQDKLSHANWEAHLGQAESLFVNAATWGLMLTGKLIKLDAVKTSDVGGFLGRLTARSSEPVIRMALKEGMRILGHQFVMGRTIKEALSRSKGDGHNQYLYSFDMLGEAALTTADAEHYFQAYTDAIDTIAAETGTEGDLVARPGISVKLSALHPRFEFAKQSRVLEELVPPVLALAKQAKAADIGLTIDAEEAETLETTLDVFAAVFASEDLAGWEGLGIAVQAYLKRASYVVDWLAALARKHQRRIMVRLVKGAYWDSEVKRAQERGLKDYPVFTRKQSTDVSYLACARRIINAPDAFYPKFATHNASTLAAVLELMGERRDFEFQRLHGMGESLYDDLVSDQGMQVACRVYGPVGSHQDLLPYLVRRLLENGANTSFVNRISDAQAPIETLIADPVEILHGIDQLPHPRIVLPKDIYGDERRNSQGINLYDIEELTPLAQEMATAIQAPRQAAPLIGGKLIEREPREVINPANTDEVIGTVADATDVDVEQALSLAHEASHQWQRTAVSQRADILVRAAELMEQRKSELMALVIKEGGRTIADALSEVREAIDSCRYYALRARQEMEAPTLLPGPTGERNELQLCGRGVFVCISPWNFPVAIYTGQIAAALAAGNTVIAKPSSQTPLSAMCVVRILLEAGVPEDVLHLLPGSGGAIGQALVEDPRVAGVVFTGSTDTARRINLALAKRPGPIVPFIAETGGQNAMIVDSSALPEQVVVDAITSAFNSAGQRCSALRVLFVQEEIADRTFDLLYGAMDELSIGDPALLTTDVGPVIDAAAKKALEQHIDEMKQVARQHHQVSLDLNASTGHFVAPFACEIDSLDQLAQENFGPILHLIRYQSKHLDDVIKSINATGYGLTLGIHTRIESTASYIRERVNVGNIYVNRNMIGAVVGTQPFGGEGLSGTGPKAGGPYYLHRFATEHTYTVNTAAIGGNASLLTIDED